MAQRRMALLDGTLILIGAGISVLFISTDGNGQNPFPVAIGMLVVVLVVGVVSLAMAKIVRNLLVAILASAVVTDLLFVLYSVCQLNASKDPYAGEAAMMFPIVFAVVTSPAVLLSSIGFGNWAKRFWQKREMAGKAPNIEP